jgi:hypothetical protein
MRLIQSEQYYIIMLSIFAGIIFHKLQGDFFGNHINMTHFVCELDTAYGSNWRQRFDERHLNWHQFHQIDRKVQDRNVGY